MTRWTWLVVAAAAGCGDSPTPVNTAPLSEQQKQAIRDEDRRVTDEETGSQTIRGKRK